MQEIMKQVNALFDTLVAKNAEADARDVKIRARSDAQEKAAKCQEEKKVELGEREEKVSMIESVAKLSEENKGGLKRIAAEKEDLANAMRAHNAQATKDRGEFEVREKMLTDNFKTLEDQEAKLAEDQKKLAEDRKELKEQVIKEIASGIK